MPIVSNRPYDQFGKKYRVSNILTAGGRLDIAAYEKYSPVYLSAANAMTFGGYFALYPATVMYAYLYHGSDIANAFKNIFGKGKAMKHDVHMKLMQAYKEVPEWWYLAVMAAGFIMAVVMIKTFPTDMPIWGVFFALFLGVIFIIPIGLISAVSNVEIGLNVLSEMVAGFAIPGKPLAMMIFSKDNHHKISSQTLIPRNLWDYHSRPRSFFCRGFEGTYLFEFTNIRSAHDCSSVIMPKYPQGSCSLHKWLLQSFQRQ